MAAFLGAVAVASASAALLFVRHGEYAIRYAVPAPLGSGKSGGIAATAERAIIRSGFQAEPLSIWATAPEFSVTVEGASPDRPVRVQNALPLGAYERLPNGVLQRGRDIWITSPGEYAFRPKEAEAYSFLVTGDPQGYPQNLDRALRIESGALFAFCLGDLTPSGKERDFLEVKSVAEGAPLPLYFTIGNHDVMSGGRRRFRRHFGDETYSFRIGRDLFAVLDTAADYPYLGDDRVSWLARIIESPGARHRFALMHVPPIDPRPAQAHALRWGPLRRGVLRAVSASGALAFSGHIHDYAEARDGHTSYVITGGLSPDRDSRYDAHAVLVSVSPGEATWKILPLSGPAGLVSRPGAAP